MDIYFRLFITKNAENSACQEDHVAAIIDFVTIGLVVVLYLGYGQLAPWSVSHVVQGAFLENVDVSLISENVSETFTHALSLDPFNVYMHLTLSFVIYAEFLPLILKITFSSFFKFCNSCFLIT